MKLKKWKCIWYDERHTHIDSEYIIAESKEEAEKKAFCKYNGHPPAQLLTLVEVID